MNTKSIYLLLPLLALGTILQGQKAWSVPPADQIDPADTVTIYVNLAEVDCNGLRGTTDQVFMWTWDPGPGSGPTGTLADGTPIVGGNGSWTSSNAQLLMTNEGGDIYSLKMIPTEFYGVSENDVFLKDIKFLAKLVDGSQPPPLAHDGAGCGAESKTEDLTIDLPLPYCSANDKVFCFPYIIQAGLPEIPAKQTDVFTLFYDNTVETKPSVQNLSEAYVYPRVVGSDGITYSITPFANVGPNFPQLKMTGDGSGKFSWQIFPRQLFDGVVPASVDIVTMRIRIVKPPVLNANDAVDGEFIYTFMGE